MQSYKPLSSLNNQNGYIPTVPTQKYHIIREMHSRDINYKFITAGVKYLSNWHGVGINSGPRDQGPENPQEPAFKILYCNVTTSFHT